MEAIKDMMGHEAIRETSMYLHITDEPEAFGQNSKYDFLPTMVEGAKRNLENKYLCPAGKKLHYERKASPHGYKGKKYRTRKNVCSECAKQHRCLRKRSSRRSIFITEEKPPRTHCAKMIEKMDTEEGRQIYSMRMGIVEPVFANIR